MASTTSRDRAIPDLGVLCVTGAEPTAEALAARLRACSGFLQEARLDLLRCLDGPVFDLLGSPRLIVTCRGKAEGGGFAGSEAERAAILERALARRPGFLDVEVSTPPELRRALFEKARALGVRTLLSLHGKRGPLVEAERIGALAREPADVLKIAFPVEDAAELSDLRALLAREARPVVRIGMGPAGLLSRVLPRRFGSPWTYVAAEEGQATAPGQLSLAKARAYRVAEADRLTPLASLGGPQVLRSNGQRVYNALFAARPLPFHHLPVVTERPEVLGLLEALGFAGAAVTMPAKVLLVPHMDEIDAAVRRVGALNTVVLRGGRRLGLNTDLPAIEALLPDGKGKAALVLGAGGAARAAVCALTARGFGVTVCSRDPAKARSLQALGAAAAGWEHRGEIPFDLLLQATPCGSDGKTDPLPPGVPLGGRVVLDMVMADRPTPLLARAAAEGAHVIDGTEVWLRQGVLQMKALTGESLQAEELRGLLRSSG